MVDELMNVSGNIRPEALRAMDLSVVQQQLTIASIMTPRSHFWCCTAQEPAEAAFRRAPDIYDALPVIEGNDPNNKSAPVVGLMHRDRLPFRNSAARVGDLMDANALGSAHPQDRLLVVYMNGLSGSPVEFVSSGDDVVGLVTPADLQRLPIRTALFALIIDIEQAVGDLIDLVLPDPATWKEHVSDGLRGALRQGLNRAASRDDIGQAVLSIDFSVKMALAEQCFPQAEHQRWVSSEKDEIRRLRNQVAHGAPLENVFALPDQIRRLVRLRQLVLSRIDEERAR